MDAGVTVDLTELTYTECEGVDGGACQPEG